VAIARSRRFRPSLRRVAITLIVATVTATAAFLPFAGRFLAVEDPLERADGIVVLAGARAERWLEAVDLYREGWAPHILLSPGRFDAAEAELRRRGVTFPTSVELTRKALLELGVTAAAIAEIPGSVDNTAQEAVAARRIAVTAGWRRIIVVTSRYHARRSRFAFRREFRETSILTLIRASRYDPTVPARWWRNRADIRWVTSELEKLLLYWVGLGE
jgi:uncharacterized SAM-binding protein YcdF (DUF218 family)